MAAIKVVYMGLLLLVFGYLQDLNSGTLVAAGKSKAKKEKQLTDAYYVADSDIEEAIQTKNWTSPIVPPTLYVPLATEEGRKQAITLRNLLARDALRNNTKYDPRDVQAVVNGSLWHVTRFMVPLDSDVDLGYSSELIPLKDSWTRMHTNLEWRQTMAVNEDNPTEVWPCEFWIAGIIHVTVPRQRDPQNGGSRLIPVFEFAKEVGYEGKLGREWQRFIQWQFDQVDRWMGWYSWPMMVTFNRLSWSTLPGSQELLEHRDVAEHFAGKLSRLYADRSSLSESYAGSMVGSSLDVIRYVIPDKTKNSVRFIRNAIELYKVVKKRDLPISVGGIRLPVAESLFSEFYVRQEKVDSPLKSCTPLKSLMTHDKGWSQSEVDKFLSNNRLTIEYMRKELNIV